jgi:hypothetical protein
VVALRGSVFTEDPPSFSWFFTSQKGKPPHLYTKYCTRMAA